MGAMNTVRRPRCATPRSCAASLRASLRGDGSLAGHVGEAVGDALVAIDAGLVARIVTRGERGGMRFRGALALAREVHRQELVAVAALERIVGLEARPLALGQLPPLGNELLARADGAEDEAPDL